MEKTKISSLTQTLIKILFLSQGIFVVATGITGVLAYVDCETFECVRIVRAAELVSGLGGLHLLGGLICFRHRCAESGGKKYLGFIFCSSWTVGSMILLQVYLYGQVMSTPVLVIMILTVVYGFLVICEHVLHCCEFHQNNKKTKAELLPMVSS